MQCLGSISKIHRDQNNYYYKILYNGGETAYVNILNDHVIRVYSNLNKEDKYREEAIPNRAGDEAKINVKSIEDYGREAFEKSGFDENNWNITTGKIKLSFNKEDGTMTITDIVTNKVVLKEKNSVAYNPDLKSCSMELEQQENERYFGCGMQPGEFILKGKQIKLINVDNISPCPFYWSTSGYGILRNCFDEGDYDFSGTSVKTTHINKTTNPESSINFDALFFINQNPKDILKDFFDFTGSPPLMPEYAFYEGYCRDFQDYSSEDENSAKSIVTMFDKEDMPLGWVMFDDIKDTHNGNLKELVEFTNENGSAVASYIKDINKIKTDVAAGIIGFYLWDPDVISDISATLNSLKKAVDEIKEQKKRLMIFTNYSWAGGQRYSGSTTVIRPGGKWENIKFDIPTLIGAGLSGQPMLWTRIDGHEGTYNMDINVREFQWKSFTPFCFNSASSNDIYNKTPFGAKVTHNDAEATNINRTYLKLRSMLTPYNYTIAQQSTEGLPMMRAMFLEFPDDKHAWLPENCKYQYMWGPHFLIAPIYEEKCTCGAFKKELYLPDPNQVWIDFFTGNMYQGGRSIIGNFPLWKLPVFVKAGAIIPWIHPHNNPKKNRKDARLYLIYPCGKTKFTVYEDDGTSLDYQDNYAETEITVNAPESDESGDLEITINKTTGQYKGMPYERLTFVCIMATKGIKPNSLQVTYNGNSVRIIKTMNASQFFIFSHAYMLEKKFTLSHYFNELEKEEDIGQSFLLLKLERVDVTKTVIKINIKNFQTKRRRHFVDQFDRGKSSQSK